MRASRGSRRKSVNQSSRVSGRGRRASVSELLAPRRPVNKQEHTIHDDAGAQTSVVPLAKARRRSSSAKKERDRGGGRSRSGSTLTRRSRSFRQISETPVRGFGAPHQKTTTDVWDGSNVSGFEDTYSGSLEEFQREEAFQWTAELKRKYKYSKDNYGMTKRDFITKEKERIALQQEEEETFSESGMSAYSVVQPQEPPKALGPKQKFPWTEDQKARFVRTGMTSKEFIEKEMGLSIEKFEWNEDRTKRYWILHESTGMDKYEFARREVEQLKHSLTPEVAPSVLGSIREGSGGESEPEKQYLEMRAAKFMDTEPQMAVPVTKEEAKGMPRERRAGTPQEPETKEPETDPEPEPEKPEAEPETALAPFTAKEEVVLPQRSKTMSTIDSILSTGIKGIAGGLTGVLGTSALVAGNILPFATPMILPIAAGAALAMGAGHLAYQGAKKLQKVITAPKTTSVIKQVGSTMKNIGKGALSLVTKGEEHKKSESGSEEKPQSEEKPPLALPNIPYDQQMHVTPQKKGRPEKHRASPRRESLFPFRTPPKDDPKNMKGALLKAEKALIDVSGKVQELQKRDLKQEALQMDIDQNPDDSPNEDAVKRHYDRLKSSINKQITPLLKQVATYKVQIDWMRDAIVKTRTSKYSTEELRRYSSISHIKTPERAELARELIDAQARQKPVEFGFDIGSKSKKELTAKIKTVFESKLSKIKEKRLQGDPEEKKETFEETFQATKGKKQEPFKPKSYQIEEGEFPSGIGEQLTYEAPGGEFNPMNPGKGSLHPRPREQSYQVPDPDRPNYDTPPVPDVPMAKMSSGNPSGMTQDYANESMEHLSRTQDPNVPHHQTAGGGTPFTGGRTGRTDSIYGVGTQYELGTPDASDASGSRRTQFGGEHDVLMTPAPNIPAHPQPPSTLLQRNNFFQLVSEIPGIAPQFLDRTEEDLARDPEFIRGQMRKIHDGDIRDKKDRFWIHNFSALKTQLEELKLAQRAPQLKREHITEQERQQSRTRGHRGPRPPAPPPIPASDLDLAVGVPPQMGHQDIHEQLHLRGQRHAHERGQDRDPPPRGRDRDPLPRGRYREPAPRGRDREPAPREAARARAQDRTLAEMHARLRYAQGGAPFAQGQAPIIITAPGAPARKQQPTIKVTQTVKQQQRQDATIRKKRVAKGNQSALSKKRKEYNTLKTAAKKAITKSKNEHYKKANDKIKRLPPKQRKGARATLRESLKRRKNALLAQLPAGGRLKLRDLQTLILKARKIKW